MTEVYEKHPDAYMISKHCGLAKILLPSDFENTRRMRIRQNGMLYNATVWPLLVARICQCAASFVSPQTAKALLRNAKSVQSHIPANLTHALRSLADEQQPKMLDIKKDYAQMGKLPVDEELVAIIGTWCDWIVQQQ